MLWDSVAITGTGNVDKVEGHMDSSQYQQILDKYGMFKNQSQS